MSKMAADACVLLLVDQVAALLQVSTRTVWRLLSSGESSKPARMRCDGLIDPELERARDIRRTPIERHLAAFEKSLKKTSPKQVKLVMSRVRRIIADACIESTADINIDTVEETLQERLATGEIGSRTYNHYRQLLQLDSRKLDAAQPVSRDEAAQRSGGHPPRASSPSA